jgi:nucleoside-diphosphate-sugar epimerase
MSSLTAFVSGPTGALGRPVVRQLIAAGHRVPALAHGDAAIEPIRRLGAEPVSGDPFDPSSLTTAMAGADAVLHLATRIPPATKSGKSEAWLENDRIRRDGTRNVVNAALAAGVGTLVYPSFAFVYPKVVTNGLTPLLGNPRNRRIHSLSRRWMPNSRWGASLHLADAVSRCGWEASTVRTTRILSKCARWRGAACRRYQVEGTHSSPPSASMMRPRRSWQRCRRK